MHGPDGTDYDNRIDFVEVERPERLVYIHGGGDGDEPFQVAVTFAERGRQTEVTMRMLFPSAEELDRVIREYGALEGAKSTMERLDEHLANIAGSGE